MPDPTIGFLSPIAARTLIAVAPRVAMKVGLVRSPMLGDPRRDPGNLPGENHVLLQIPVCFGRFGLRDPRVDFSVRLTWQGIGRGTPYAMAFAGGRKPEPEYALRPTTPRVVPVVIRSLIGESVRLSTDSEIKPVCAPKDSARLLDMGVWWSLSEPRTDFPPGVHWLRVEIQVGQKLVDRAHYKLIVPKPGEGNEGFTLARIPPLGMPTADRP